MNANRQFDEDDLVLFAMRLLAEPEHSAIAQFVASDAAAQRRLAEIQGALGLYAAASVEPRPLPEGSLQRFLNRVGKEAHPEASQRLEASPAASSLPYTSAGTTPESPSAAKTPLTLVRPSAQQRPQSRWMAPVGWAIAAMLALAAGITLKQKSSLRETLSSKDSELTALNSDAANLRRERDALKAAVNVQQQQLDASGSELAATQGQVNANKQAALNARTAEANLQASLSAQAAQLNAERQRAAEAEREKNRLQGTLAAQADQLAALQANTSNAEVLATLTDPTALRVVLTKPKSKPAPVGRAAYIANKGSLVFLANNLTPLKANKVYELWILPASGANPVPAGTFTPDAQGNAHLVYARFPNAVPAKGFAITVENAGGATTPTLPLILAGS